jgi:hypothetical protein
MMNGGITTRMKQELSALKKGAIQHALDATRALAADPDGAGSRQASDAIGLL